MIMLPLIPIISLLISLLFLLIRHRKSILSVLFSRPKPAAAAENYTRLPSNEPEYSNTHRESNIPETPLTKYFDPDTSIIYKGILEPPSPVVSPVIRDSLEEENKGWMDRIVVSLVDWMVEYVRDERSF
ncbi:hypothetical protein BO94DRAFT_541212 [Aspergillus sclerotioniger CBS 115572]|uniref:Uncharacterized protein n=1 Tax=Aspergillus sclerotioniger CBS 115572 TaxID=1450535 RepID=A0A317XF61_9EURO|nr:hypothetical protein BO94DRAFT_541212 [Aspergillus sclerotioniger CBS 115572]PWY96387.1 hypothetical protein BO94DRAFT_541212 [Aspergillus sclerotioniger CBS 115572]